MDTLITISEASRRSGVSASALRFYEQRGLIRSERNGAAHRRYRRDVLRRIAFIVFAQRIGLSLDEIGAELATLPDGTTPKAEHWAAISGNWVKRVDLRIAELERLKSGLMGCIGCGCLSLERCALSNPDDREARHGPGPSRWTADPQASD